MALTVVQNGRTNVSGNRLTVSLNAATDDSTWNAGGEAFDATSYVANPEMVHIENGSGYVFQYDATNKKIKAYIQSHVRDDGGGGSAAAVTLQLVEATGKDLRTVPIKIMITGGRA